MGVDAGPGRPRAVIVTASVGAGHDGAARELARRLEHDGFTVDVHDYLDVLPGRLGPWLRAVYARQLATAPRTWGWVLGALHLLPWLARLVASAAGLAGRRRMLEILRCLPAPAVVVSTYPLASHLLGELRRREQLTAPVLTFLTDMSVHRLWVCHGVDAHLALHPVAAAQAEAHGARRVSIVGPAVRPAFDPACTADRGRHRAALREAFGLPADAVVALVVAGSLGVGEVEQAARDILATGRAAPVVVCGRNTALAARLDQLQGIRVLSWVQDMPSVLHASDIVVQNAGGLSSLEALCAGVPVITYRSIAGHGRANAAALEAAGLAPWIRTPAELDEALRTATASAPAQLPCAPDPAALIAEMAAPAYLPGAQW